MGTLDRQLQRYIPDGRGNILGGLPAVETLRLIQEVREALRKSDGRSVNVRRPYSGTKGQEANRAENPSITHDTRSPTSNDGVVKCW